ncbi:hypothetical protein J2741_000678 [Methanolinea mesophila]|uniref:diadenylate cyclase n=1 Tax=Methanolinea mesophila TaxID=547055 RepID=UPI001AE6A910|nr:diadenylate cyclase [Methanolinea mesophila]MBP1928131.1 hypothetical protein [Methanolinea mesophila]
MGDRSGNRKIIHHIRKFSDISFDLEMSNNNTFQTRFDSFVYFCENDEVMKIISSRLKNADVRFDDWWNRGRDAGGQAPGSKQFTLPLGDFEKDALLYQLVLRIFERKIDLKQFCTEYFGETNYIGMIFEFKQAVLSPLIRSMGYMLKDILIELEEPAGNGTPDGGSYRDNPNAQYKYPGVLTPGETADILAGTDVDDMIFYRVLEIAEKLNKYGYEGKRIGTSFVVGNYEEIEQHIVKNPTNPFKETGHRILDRDTLEFVERYATLDGAVIITGDGLVMDAGAIIAADIRNLGVSGGARHIFAAAITKSSNSVSVVVSQSGGIRIYKHGEEIKKIP